MKRKRLTAIAAVVAMVSAMALIIVPAGAAVGGAVTGSVSVKPTAHKALHRLGKVNLRQLASVRHSATEAKRILKAQMRGQRLIHRTVGSILGRGISSAGLSIPAPPNYTVKGTTTSDFKGFMGLGARDNAAFAGGDLEPPDQGLCVGGGNVLESINLVEQVFGTDGTPKMQFPVFVNDFFLQDPSIFLSDPKCYRDPTTGLWYQTMLQIDFNNTPPTSATLLAASLTTDPTGAWFIYSFDTTNGDGSDPLHPSCPCFGDQPLLGTNADGVYISTNEFAIGAANNGHFFDGSQIYAVAKVGLAGGTVFDVAAYDTYCDPSQPGLNPLWPSGCAPTVGTPDLNNQVASLQPTESVDGLGATSHGGTEWFLATGDFLEAPGDLAKFLEIAAITGTTNLQNGQNPNAITFNNLRSETFGMPPTVGGEFLGSAPQKAGPIPLGTNVGEAEGRVSTNDDRMNQTVWANGDIWGSASTIVKGNGAHQRTGIAWFAVRPKFSGANVQGAIHAQGYVAAPESVFFPSAVVTPSGKLTMALSIVGSDMFPSAGYIKSVPMTGTGTIHIYAKGQAPEDGFCEYPVAFPQCAGIPGRWGDYSTAVAMSGGGVWFANEWIPPAQFRDFFANFGTFIGKVKP